MNRKIVVPKPVSTAIGSFGLPRELVNRLLSQLHNEVQRDYERFRHFRLIDERMYRHRLLIRTDGGKHLFTFAIDDTTSPELLVIVGVVYDKE